jgi:hypothetical protein
MVHFLATLQSKYRSTESQKQKNLELTVEIHKTSQNTYHLICLSIIWQNVHRTTGVRNPTSCFDWIDVIKPSPAQPNKTDQNNQGIIESVHIFIIT